jgi:hypothetical protein
MPRLPWQKAKPVENPVYAWTTGGERAIVHVKLVGKGGFGEVHICAEDYPTLRSGHRGRY